MIAETYWELMGNWPHWAFEITLMIIFDGLIGVVGMRLFKKWLKNHDEKKHGHQHCEDAHQETLFKESLCMYCNKATDPGYLAHEKCAKESRKK